MIGARTASRELALQALYAREMAPDDPLIACQSALDSAEVPEPVRAHARVLVDGVLGQMSQIDADIVGAADNWELKRLATVDRNILRLALYEMLHAEDVPARVAINEAIELGKRFSTAQSGGFVNGVLDALRQRHGLPAGEAPAALDEPSDESPRELLPPTDSPSD